MILIRKVHGLDICYWLLIYSFKDKTNLDNKDINVLLYEDKFTGIKPKNKK